MFNKKLSVLRNVSKEEIKKIRVEYENTKAIVEQKITVKVVVVPKKLANIVVK